MRGVAMFAVVALAGCPDPAEPPWVQINAITEAPPASTATIRNTEYVNGATLDVFSITLSVGVAVGTRCADSCADNNSFERGCTGAALTSADPSKLGVFPIYHDGEPGDFALVARAPGPTTLHVITGCATQDYTVNVVPRP